MIRRAVAATTLALIAVSCGADDDDPAASDDVVDDADPAAAAPGTEQPDTATADTAGSAAADSTTTTPATTASDDADTTDAVGGETPAAAVTPSRTIYGQVLTLDGLTLYGFTMDERGSGRSSCSDDCLAAWPPVPGDAPVHEDVTAEASTLEREDGFEQLVIGGWPMYFYAGDQPGTTNGQNVNGVWFVVTADGELVMTEQVVEGY